MQFLYTISLVHTNLMLYFRLSTFNPFNYCKFKLPDLSLTLVWNLQRDLLSLTRKIAKYLDESIALTYNGRAISLKRYKTLRKFQNKIITKIS